MKVFWRIFPAFVEVVTTYVWTIVAVDDSVGIDHGYDLEDKILSEFFSFLIRREKELNNAVADIWTYTLPGMNTGCDDDVSFVDFLKRVFFSYS